MIDATFHSAPRHFRQLLVFHGIVQGKAIPVAYICMSHKSDALYAAIFDRLKPEVNAEHIFCDHEKPLLSGILSAWPDIKVIFDFFYLRILNPFRFILVCSTLVNATAANGSA